MEGPKKDMDFKKPPCPSKPHLPKEGGIVGPPFQKCFARNDTTKVSFHAVEHKIEP